MNREWLLKIYQLEKVVDLELSLGLPQDGENLHVRIEILKDMNNKDGYKVRVYRSEYYRIQPTFPQLESNPQHEPSDEVIWVEDSFLLEPNYEVHTTSSENALEHVLNVIGEKFRF